MDILADGGIKGPKKQESGKPVLGNLKGVGARWDKPTSETPTRPRGRVDSPVTRLRRAARVGRVSPI